MWWTSPQVWRRRLESRITRGCAPSEMPYMPAHDSTLAPSASDRFGAFGGRYVPETLIPALDELERAYDEARADPSYIADVEHMLNTYVGRPSPLSDAPRLSRHVGARVWLKREDLNHTGAHKINNTVGQVLLARRMGKHRIIAETGAGQHGVATATVCARYGMECVVYMGEEDMRRQALNVWRMRLMGATVVPGTGGAGDERDAHAQGRDERSDPRLGRHGRGLALRDRLGGRARAVSSHGAGFP